MYTRYEQVTYTLNNVVIYCFQTVVLAVIAGLDQLTATATKKVLQLIAQRLADRRRADRQAIPDAKRPLPPPVQDLVPVLLLDLAAAAALAVAVVQACLLYTSRCV